MGAKMGTLLIPLTKSAIRTASLVNIMTISLLNAQLAPLAPIAVLFKMESLLSAGASEDNP